MVSENATCDDFFFVVAEKQWILDYELQKKGGIMDVHGKYLRSTKCYFEKKRK
jgi:hypothetical protein